MGEKFALRIDKHKSDSNDQKSGIHATRLTLKFQTAASALVVSTCHNKPHFWRYESKTKQPPLACDRFCLLDDAQKSVTMRVSAICAQPCARKVCAPLILAGCSGDARRFDRLPRRSERAARLRRSSHLAVRKFAPVRELCAPSAARERHRGIEGGGGDDARVSAPRSESESAKRERRLNCEIARAR